MMEIQRPKLNILVEEVQVQCLLGLASWDSLQHFLTDEKLRQSRMLWGTLHSFLAHAAMISKMVSPPRNGDIGRVRSRALKEVLDVGHGSPIFNRAARNNVEHFDERLDAWLADDSGGLLECVFDERADLDYLLEGGSGGNKSWRIWRVLVIQGMVLVTQGRNGVEETPLLPIAAELQRIDEKATGYVSSDSTVHRVFPQG